MRVLVVTQTHVTTESPLRAAAWVSLDSTRDDFIFVPPPTAHPSSLDVHIQQTQ